MRFENEASILMAKKVRRMMLLKEAVGLEGLGSGGTRPYGQVA